ncbi:MAG: DUF1127 domain-containing protein [Alphaproteobacteria bacterium]|nr:DUF1127 domain-containing protein [Alphaproteobacteria bacterium]
MNAGVLKAHADTSFAAARPSQSLTEWVSPLGQILGTWHRRATQRHALARLDDHLLKDIGLDRQSVAAEIAKPFWRA